MSTIMAGELLDVSQRAALSAVSPHLEYLQQQNAALWQGGLENVSGMTMDISLSPSMPHFENPPIRGDVIANTTRLMRLSRIGNEHMAQGSMLE
jgi:hypothetical protein